MGKGLRAGINNTNRGWEPIILAKRKQWMSNKAWYCDITWMDILIVGELKSRNWNEAMGNIVVKTPGDEKMFD